MESTSAPPATRALGASYQWIFWGAFYASGIIGSLLVYGLLQERIMAQPYGGTELFEVSAFLVFCNRAWSVIFASSMIVAKDGESFNNHAPLWKYLAISFSNVSATWCQYEALKYVSFPVQMLGKSFKMMPVMVWGIIISSKHYAVRDWLIALCVTGGVTEFLMTGPTSSEHTEGTASRGLVLLACFLALDGFTSTMQEKLFKEHKTSKYNQMFFVNVFSMFVSFSEMFITGGLSTALAFCGRHPTLLRDATTLSIASVSGQFFIYSQVKEFGALTFAATMNVRQVVSILVSYATYGHAVTFLQILGLFLVFGALFYKSYAAFATRETELIKKEKDAAISEKAPLLPDEAKQNKAVV